MFSSFGGLSLWHCVWSFTASLYPIGSLPNLITLHLNITVFLKLWLPLKLAQVLSTPTSGALAIFSVRTPTPSGTHMWAVFFFCLFHPFSCFVSIFCELCRPLSFLRANCQSIWLTIEGQTFWAALKGLFYVKTFVSLSQNVVLVSLHLMSSQWKKLCVPSYLHVFISSYLHWKQKTMP